MALGYAEPGSARTTVAACTATFAMLFNITAPMVAFGRLEDDLGAGFDDLQWVVSGYSLALAVFLLTAGDLADRHGRRRLFLVGVGLFVAGSVVCALAGRPLVLNLGRAGQGLGGAILLASSLALLAAEFTGRARAAAMSAWAAAIGAGVGLGPLLGGALTSAFGWRWMFLANVPLMLVAAAAVLRVRESRDPEVRRVDALGLVAFSGAMFLLVLSLSRGNAAGWSSAAILGALVGGATLLGAFVLVELRQREPMLDLDLFRNPAFVGVSLAGFALGASIWAATVYVSLWMLSAGATPVEVGLYLLPYAGAQVATAELTRRVGMRLSARVLLGGGLGLVGAGSLLMLGNAPDSDWTRLVPGLVVAGAGAAIVNASGALAVVQVVSVARSGMASALNNTSRQLGLATGTAAMGAIVEGRLAGGLDDVLLLSGMIALAGAAAAIVLVRDLSPPPSVPPERVEIVP